MLSDNNSHVLKNNKIVIKKINARQYYAEIKITLKQDNTIYQKKTLLDTGSTGSLIHLNIVRQYEFNTDKLPEARTIYNADRTKIKGEITKSIKVLMMTEINQNYHTFTISEIGNNDIILGLD